MERPLPRICDWGYVFQFPPRVDQEMGRLKSENYNEAWCFLSIPARRQGYYLLYNITINLIITLLLVSSDSCEALE